MRRYLLLSVLLLVLSGCAAYQDLEGAEVRDPDTAIVYRNADKFPNVSIMCIEGVALASTTRDNSPITVIPELDGLCT